MPIRDAERIASTEVLALRLDTGLTIAVDCRDNIDILLEECADFDRCTRGKQWQTSRTNKMDRQPAWMDFWRSCKVARREWALWDWATWACRWACSAPGGSDRPRGLTSILSRRKSLRAARATSSTFPRPALPTQIGKKRFDATDDFSRLKDMDADHHLRPHASRQASRTRPFLRPEYGEHCGRASAAGQLVVLESTTYPGTTDEDMLAILEKKGLKCPVSAYTTDGDRDGFATRRSRTSSSPSHPSAKIPETRISRPTRFPRLSAASTPPAPWRRRRSTRASLSTPTWSARRAPRR